MSSSISFTGFVILSTLIIVISGNNNAIIGSKYPEGKFQSFTDKEIIAIKQLRESVLPFLYQNFMKRDEYLIRWITDSKLDIGAAKAKLLKAIEWRKVNNIDTVTQEDYSFIQKTCPYSIKGQDKTGRPLFTIGVGKCDLRKMVLSGEISKFERFGIYMLETCAEIVRQLVKSGKDVRDGIIIVDLNGFNLRQHGCFKCLPAAFSTLTHYELYYPEYLHKVIFINVPRIANTFIDIILPTLTPATKSKVKFFGFDRHEWETYIRDLINPDQLTFQFGGYKNSQPNL